MVKKCSFKDCPVKQSEKVVHSYPKDVARCKEWILRSGNIDTDCAQVQNKIVCANHFRPKDFLDPKGKRLNRLAMPQFYDVDKIDIVKQVQLSCEDGQTNSHVQPPQDQPPQDQPPQDQLLQNQPAQDQPPQDQPAQDQPPQDQPPQDQPAQDQPPQDQPPQDQPPQDQPPQDQPAQDQPPQDQPPQDQPLRTLNGLGSLTPQNPRPFSPKLVLMEVPHNGQISTGIEDNNSSVKSQSFVLVGEAIPSNLCHSSQVADEYTSKQVHNCILKQVIFDMEKRKLLMRIKTQDALLRKHQKTIRKLKKKVENPPKPGVRRLLEELSKHVRSDYVMSFMRMQVLHGRRRPWRQIEKEMALSLYVKSPKGYLHLRNKGIQLPTRRTIQRWRQELRNMEPGLLSPEVCIEEHCLEDMCMEPVDL